MENVRWSTKIFNANAQTVHDELMEIADSNEYQTLKPQEIVDWARDHENSELHKCFTWDDTQAAASWRRQQARTVINHLVVEVIPEGKKEPTIARTMLVTETEEGIAYKPVQYMVTDEYTRVLDRAWREAKAWANRYKSLKDSGIQAIIEMIE